ERSEEVGIRKGFGGTRNSIFKQFIFENVFITTIGGAIALLLSFLILFLINESQILQGCYIKINGLAFIICIVIWLVLSFLSGVLPAMRISKIPVISALHGSVSKNGSYAYRWLRKENIWLSVELCCVFIALFSIINFFAFFGLNLFTPIGFNYNGVYEVKMYNEAENFVNQDYSTRDDIFEWIAQNPLVLETSRLDGSNPYGGTSHFSESLIYENRSIEGEKVLYVELGIGDWDFWKLKFTDGNGINIDDTVSSICPVIINEKLRTKLFGKGTAIGKQFKIEKQNFVVKGVIESYKHLGELTSEGYYLFYIRNNKYTTHTSGRGSRSITGYLRFKDGSAINSQKLLDQLKTKYSDFYFEIEPLNKYRTENLRKSIIPLLFILFLCLSVFLIVLFGMFGVIWYKINLRVPEIGLRKSVGATIPRIFREVISEVYLITLIGLLPGILIIIQFPLLGVFDFSIPVYLVSIIVSFLLIFILVGIFTLLPGKKAAKIQPAIALHEE
ncbi:MAG: FtsX-like permease family protein, partial [Bacteroidales bacterium]|nr:FtsX-like permease family protein [Bacteroidales bacterium]